MHKHFMVVDVPHLLSYGRGLATDAPGESPTFRFGPFTLSSQSLVLKKGETRIHLRPQAAKLLLLLLDRHPSRVSRPDIERHLWPEGAPDELDAGQQINTCIRLIRRCLNDNARAPTYIAAHKGDGYEFIAPLSVVGLRALAKESVGHRFPWRP